MISWWRSVTRAAQEEYGRASPASLEPIWKYEGGGKDKDRRNDAVDAYERLDEWMKNSVVDIVKNLMEAPLLVQVYPKKMANSGETTAVRTEREMVDDWPGLVEKWETGETPLPEGVILVEQLGDEGEGGKGRTTKAWGVVVQGRGVGSGPICYLLKTSRNQSGPRNEPVLYPFLRSPGEEFQGNCGIAAQELLALAGSGILMVPVLELI